MLWLENFSISYPEQNVLAHADFKAGVGITSIIGRSGIGKTSVLNAMSLQIGFQCENYHFGEMKISLDDDQFVRDHIAYLTQTDNFISDLTCIENIKLYASYANIELSTQDVLRYLEMVHLDLDPETYPDNLSGGERQRLALAQALAKQSEIILCDEFTASLDVVLKQEMLDLISHIAHEYHKIVIVTTHDPDVYNFSDVVYEIKDGALDLIKGTPVRTDISLKRKQSQKSTIYIGTVINYVSAKVNRQFSMYFMYSVITAIVVSVSAFLVFYWIQFITFQNMVNECLNSAELTVVNQSMPMVDEYTTYSINGSNQPFSMETEQQLQTIEHVEKVYPHILVQFLDREVQDPLTEFTNKIEVTLVDGEKRSLDLTSDTASLNYAVPYYPEQKFEDIQYTFDETRGVDGVYLTTNLLHYLGFDHDTYQQLEGATLKTTLYFPITYEEIASEMHNVGSDIPVPFTLYDPIAVPLEVTIPVKGVQYEWYLPEMSVLMYLSYDFIETHYRQVLNQHQGIEPRWRPNAYKLFIDDPEYMDEVNQQVKTIDSQITTGARYYSNIHSFEQSSYVRSVTLVVLMIVVGSGLILSYVFGIFYHQKNKKDESYFIRNKLSVKEYKQFVGLDILVQSIIVFILGLPLLYFAFYLTSGKALYARFDLMSQTTFWILTTFVLLILIQSTISRVYAYKKYKRRCRYDTIR